MNKEINERINKILGVHKAREVMGIEESKKQIDIIMYLCWIRWELKGLLKLKNRNKYFDLIDSMYNLASLCCDKYERLDL